MGPERNRQNQHHGPRPEPKLRLVGRLDGDLDGWPLNLVAASRDVVLVADRFRTLLVLRRIWKLNQQTVRNLFAQPDLRLLIRVGRIGPTEVFPHPNWLMRLFLPRE